jgi:phosphoribosylaminoimidazolecarboxamide formyltransferase/IMP cyclohydrolase
VRALLSVYDKEGLVELAQGLADLGWELVASGNTPPRWPTPASPTSRWPRSPAPPRCSAAGSRRCTPRSTGGSWPTGRRAEPPGRPRGPGDRAIDLVVSNLYPFSSDPSIELIDIGGPTMVRAAAKNHAHVGIVTVDPADYPCRARGAAPFGLAVGATRRRLARAAFAHTAAYDAAIVAWFDAGPGGRGRRPELLPADAPPHPRAHRGAPLRREPAPARGPLPHRRSRAGGTRCPAARGKELSYLNLFDADAAWRLVHELAGDAGSRRWPSSSTPTLRGRGGRRPGHRLRAGARVRPSRPSAGWWPSGGGDRGAGRRRGRRAPGRRHHRPVLRARGARES